MREIINCEQGSLEWYAARCGVPSASNFDLIVTTKGDPSKSRTKYMNKLAGEYVCGVPEDTYQSPAMARGSEMEAEARFFYEMMTEERVEQVGFVKVDGYGCSPDGLVNDGIIEIKCPSLAVHVEYLLAGVLPTAYFQQVHGQLLVTDRPWCDFMSYYPGIKPLIVRVQRDDVFISKLKSELALFCQELQEVIKRVE